MPDPDRQFGDDHEGYEVVPDPPDIPDAVSCACARSYMAGAEALINMAMKEITAIDGQFVVYTELLHMRAQMNITIERSAEEEGLPNDNPG